MLPILLFPCDDIGNIGSDITEEEKRTVMKRAGKRTERKTGKRTGRVMKVLIIILVLLACLVIWFLVPYSPLKSEFRSDIDEIIATNRADEGRVLTKDDFKDLPAAIQKYVENCGYIGAPYMNQVCMEYENVKFMQGRQGPTLKINYTQYDFVKTPCRMALIDSSMLGIPFEGYDYYRDGVGGMKGVLAKGVTLFNQTGEDMDRACLVTFLAESMFAPSILLQEYIDMEQLDAYHVIATITYGGQTVSGVFEFNEGYEYTSFTTNDRAVANGDGVMEYVP